MDSVRARFVDQIDAGNPYQAPEASLAALRAEIRRPSVYTAISLFCWALGVFFLLVFGLLMYYVSTRIGWARVTISPSGGPKVFLFAFLILLCMLSYFAAGRLLWVRRDRPGLILCVCAMAMTYLATWAYSSIPNRTPRRVSEVQILSANSSTTIRPLLPDHA
jgi:hypothetical protein